jgi:hypothetical protein
MKQNGEAQAQIKLYDSIENQLDAASERANRVDQMLHHTAPTSRTITAPSPKTSAVTLINKNPRLVKFFINGMLARSHFAPLFLRTAVKALPVPVLMPLS